MLVVDSSVWIDLLRGARNAQVEELEHVLHDGIVDVRVPDLVLFEVLRGCGNARDLAQARDALESIGVVSTGGAGLATQAAANYRLLRQRGVTTRSAIDVLIATYCIANDCHLLHRDRDYDAFAAHCGLRVWARDAAH